MDSTVREVHKASVVIHSEMGLNGRAAVSFVETAQLYEACITIWKGTRAWDGCSISQLIMMGAQPLDRLLIEAHGSEAGKAVDAILCLIEKGFNLEPDEVIAKWDHTSNTRWVEQISDPVTGGTQGLLMAI